MLPTRVLCPRHMLSLCHVLRSYPTFSSPHRCRLIPLLVSTNRRVTSRRVTSRRVTGGLPQHALQPAPGHSEPPPSANDGTSTAFPPKSSRRRKSSIPVAPTSIDEEVSVEDTLEPSKTELYLQFLATSGREPTLSDLERLKPSTCPDAESPVFAQSYNALVDSLCRSFSNDQLREFIISYGLPPMYSSRRRKKPQYAEAIMEQKWDWPSLKEIQRKHRIQTELITRGTNFIL